MDRYDLEEINKIITTKQVRIDELEHKCNTLYKLCQKYEDYINSHNLADLKIEYKNKNGKSIKKLQDFDEITYLTIPMQLYVVNNKKTE